jgi:L-Ala-D/L-Glu epimerase
MKLSWSTFEIHPRVPFRIARSSTTAYTRTLVHLRDEGGAEGWGEAAPNTFYREDERTVHAALLALEPVLRDVGGVGTLEEVEALEDALRDTLPGDASARAAVSAAAHDMLGRRLGRPLFDVLGLNPNTAPPTSFTIAIPPDADELVRRVEEARDYPILKVKLGTERDEWIARTVRRAAPRATLRADHGRAAGGPGIRAARAAVGASGRGRREAVARRRPYQDRGRRILH